MKRKKKTNKPHILTMKSAACSDMEGIVLDKHGYEMAVMLHDNGEWVTRYIHELVAEAFIPNPDNKKYIRHKDGNIRNNRATNLEWSDEPEL